MQVETKINKRRTDDKSMVTPYAFSVSDELLNTPLAQPAKRLLAITIDLICIAVISSVNIFAWLFIGALSVFGLVKNRSANLWIKSLLVFIIGLSSIVVLQTLVGHVPFSLDSGDSQDNKSQLVAPSINEEAENVETDLAHNGASVDKSNSGVIRWAKSLLIDLGLGLSWAAAYFTILTTYWKGQTVGKKLLRIQVVLLDGSTPNLWQAFGRYGGYGAGVSTGLLGFLQIFWDSNRQAIQDKISETLVIKKEISQEGVENTASILAEK